MYYLNYNGRSVAESETEITYSTEMRGWHVGNELFSDFDGKTYSVGNEKLEAPADATPVVDDGAIEGESTTVAE